MSYKTCKDYNFNMNYTEWSVDYDNNCCYNCRKNYEPCGIIAMINNIILSKNPQKWLLQHYIKVSFFGKHKMAVIEQLPEKYKDIYEKLLILK